MKAPGDRPRRKSDSASRSQGEPSLCQSLAVTFGQRKRTGSAKVKLPGFRPCGFRHGDRCPFEKSGYGLDCEHALYRVPVVREGDRAANVQGLLP